MENGDWPKFENRLCHGTGKRPETAYVMGRREYNVIVHFCLLSKAATSTQDSDQTALPFFTRFKL